jgi:hypothetical protein
MRSKVLKKKSPGIRKTAVSGKKKTGKRWSSVEWVCIGGDISPSSLSLAGLARTKDGKLRSGSISVRWPKEVDYFGRMAKLAKAHDFIHDVIATLKVLPELNEIAIAIEEAVPIGMLQRGTKGKKSGATGAWMKQQIQISGAFIGGLLRYGYKDIYEIQANQWRALVAKDLGITTHASKWNTQDVLKLPDGYHAKSNTVGKYRAQQWVEEFHPKWDGKWPDIIASSHGQISRPPTSKAQGVQADDRYEAYAIAEWLRRELKKGQK